MNRMIPLAVVVLSLLPLEAAICGEDSRDTVAGPVDLGKCNLVVEEVSRVEKTMGARGKAIEASKRGSMLIELKIHGTGPCDGELGLYPSMFSLTCVYRGVRRIIASLAIGVKPRMPTGEIQDYWLNEPEASMLIGCETGGSIDFYALFEVPEEVREFTLQIPQALQQVSTQTPGNWGQRVLKKS